MILQHFSVVHLKLQSLEQYSIKNGHLVEDFLTTVCMQKSVMDHNELLIQT